MICVFIVVLYCSTTNEPLILLVARANDFINKKAKPISLYDYIMCIPVDFTMGDRHFARKNRSKGLDYKNTRITASGNSV
ncbi:hypothetical protein [Sphingobacterium lactis]|uniref:hypothetical protein n=1 Tax=Sphingobacterium lactis TaxID=797291 RepID=UPI003DA53A2F